MMVSVRVSDGVGAGVDVVSAVGLSLSLSVVGMGRMEKKEESAGVVVYERLALY